MKYLFFLSFAFVIVFSSCLKDIGNLELKSNANFYIPVAHGEISVEELLKTIDSDSLLQSGENNELVFLYENPSIMEFDLNEIIDFATVFSLQKYKYSFGDLDVDAFNMSASLSLSEIRKGLSGMSEFSTLADFSTVSFPPIDYSESNNDAPSFEIPAGNTEFTEAIFSDGNMIFHVKNNFPVSVGFRIVLSDQDNFIENLDFGMTGGEIMTGATSQVSIDLSGKKIVPPLIYELVSFKTAGSVNSVFIDYSQSLDFLLQFSSLKVSKAILNKKSLKIDFPLDTMIFDPGDDIKITSASIESLDMNFILTKNFSEDIDVDVEFLSIKDEGKNLKCALVNRSIGSNDNRISLDNVFMDLSQSGQGSNSVPYILSYELSSENYLKFDATNFIELEIQMSNLHLSEVKGDFGHRKLPFDGAEISLNTEIWDQLNDNLVIEDPVLKLFIDNPFGFSSVANINVWGINKKGESASMKVNNIAIDYPKTESQGYLSTEVVFDNNSSAITDLLQLPPDSLLRFSGEIEINLDTVSGVPNQNFINFNKTVNIGYAIQVPIVLKGNLYSLSDTISWLGSAFDSIQNSVFLSIRVINEIPIGIDFSLLPINTISHTVTGEEFNFETIKSAVTDESGNMLEAAETEFTTELTTQQVSSFQKANAVRIAAQIKSPEDGARPAKLKPEYKLSLYVYLETGLNKSNL